VGTIKQRTNKPPKSKGRPKGSPNKTTALLKDAILMAAEQAGNGDIVEYLAIQAKLTPGPFMALLGKVLPTQIAGADGGNLVIEIRRFAQNNTAE
jgi:hypothetical protein